MSSTPPVRPRPVRPVPVCFSKDQSPATKRCGQGGGLVGRLDQRAVSEERGPSCPVSRMLCGVRPEQRTHGSKKFELVWSSDVLCRMAQRSLIYTYVCLVKEVPGLRVFRDDQVSRLFQFAQVAEVLGREFEPFAESPWTSHSCWGRPDEARFSLHLRPRSLEMPR